MKWIIVTKEIPTEENVLKFGGYHKTQTWLEGMGGELHLLKDVTSVSDRQWFAHWYGYKTEGIAKRAMASREKANAKFPSCSLRLWRYEMAVQAVDVD